MRLAFCALEPVALMKWFPADSVMTSKHNSAFLLSISQSHISVAADVTIRRLGVSYSGSTMYKVACIQIVSEATSIALRTFAN